MKLWDTLRERRAAKREERERQAQDDLVAINRGEAHDLSGADCLPFAQARYGSQGGPENLGGFRLGLRANSSVSPCRQTSRAAGSLCMHRFADERNADISQAHCLRGPCLLLQSVDHFGFQQLEPI
jgi:hypothetical protein